MTTQIKDTIIPGEDENISFSINSYTGEAPFDISKYFSKPFRRFSACWRGFVATFTIKNERLLLKDLNVLKDLDNPPLINGIDARFVDFFDDKILSYKNINLELDYSGRILVYNGYLKLELPPIFERANYEKALEFQFLKGKLQKQEDLSFLLEKFREELKEHALRASDDILLADILKYKKHSKKNIKKARKVIEETKTMIQTVGLKPLPRETKYPLMHSFKFIDKEFRNQFKTRFFYNYDFEGYDW